MNHKMKVLRYTCSCRLVARCIQSWRENILTNRCPMCLATTTTTTTSLHALSGSVRMPRHCLHSRRSCADQDCQWTLSVLLSASASTLSAYTTSHRHCATKAPDVEDRTSDIGGHLLLATLFRLARILSPPSLLQRRHCHSSTVSATRLLSCITGDHVDLVASTAAHATKTATRTARAACAYLDRGECRATSPSTSNGCAAYGSD